MCNDNPCWIDSGGACAVGETWSGILLCMTMGEHIVYALPLRRATNRRVMRWAIGGWSCDVKPMDESCIASDRWESRGYRARWARRKTIGLGCVVRPGERTPKVGEAPKYGLSREVNWVALV